MQKLVVKQTGELKGFLAASLNISKSKAKVLLDKRVVFVNNKRVWIASYQLKKGDVVETPLSVPPVETHCNASLPVVYEDDQYLIVNKPPFLLTNGPYSAETLLRKQKNNLEIVAVHRLDKNTSGLVIFAKKKEYFEKIKELFKQNRITKIYRAIVIGAPPQVEFTINQSIEGKTAVSHVKVLAGNKLTSLLEMKIETGRKHQIRIHLANIGCPVVGENKYNKKPIANPKLKAAPRQMLHAYRLGFVNPYTGKNISATVKEPEDFSII